MTASIHGDVAVCKVLLERKASVEYQSKVSLLCWYMVTCILDVG